MTYEILPSYKKGRTLRTERILYGKVVKDKGLYTAVIGQFFHMNKVQGTWVEWQNDEQYIKEAL